ncbi:MAG: C40 family peptidase [Burkholderiales bacterium]|nr:C40 family peptidase [Burkholderiales bacterium]MDE2564178.1 C40 family peptidase [Burkholderiales bacterium]
MPPARPAPRCVYACLAALLLAASAAVHAVPAAPEVGPPAPEPGAASAALPAPADAPTGDALLKMLREQGLAPPAGRAGSGHVVQQVRDAASELVVSAMNFLGVRYRRGGNSAAQGFDCSGFTRYVFEHSIGLVLPRRADQQARGAGLLKVARSQLRPGDLVFFNTMRRAFSHVGIYVGEGKFIHAPRPGGEVRIENLYASYWARRFDGARRAELPEPAPAATAAAPLPGDAPAAP